MDLEKFIHETLIGIKKGLRSANEELVEDGKTLGVNASATFVIDRDKSDNIEFDVAVTASEEVGKEGGASIKVISFGAGANVNKTEMQQSISRIRFKIRSSETTG